MKKLIFIVLLIVGCSTEPDVIYGCKDISACNYNPDAISDDYSCWYATSPCKCDDGKGAVTDCNDVCGGDANEDMCGICDNDVSNDCVPDCSGSDEDCCTNNGGTWSRSCDWSTIAFCYTSPGSNESQCVGVAIEGVACTENSDCPSPAWKDDQCWGGNAWEDNCGTCDSDSLNDCMLDCAGAWGGNAVELWDVCYAIETTDFLDRSDSELSGKIPPEIENLTNLISLDLSYNYFSDSIPHELGNLTKLEVLKLNNNQLSGKIPPEIGNLTNLISLDLSYNYFSDSIPYELGNLIKLEVLKLNNNQLSGSIPPEICLDTNLVQLHLSVNQIAGVIPPAIGNLIRLTELHLFNNKIAGSIPLEIGNLINLSSYSGLWLIDNQLTGVIPMEICNQGDHSPLLSHNQLCPPYPECTNGPITNSELQDISNCP